MIYLSPERPQTSVLELLPPFQEEREVTVPKMNLKLELTKWQRSVALDVCFQQRSQGLELPAFNVDLKYIDVPVSVDFHQALERVHLVLIGRTMGIGTSKAVRFEVCAGQERW